MNTEIEPLQNKLIQLLSSWSSGKLTAGGVHGEAEQLLDSYDWKEVSRSDPRSLVNEVLVQLDVLNQQLIMEDDIPAILMFLRAPAGTEAEAWLNWERYWNGIDLDDRRKQLKGNPHYAA